MSEMEVLAGLCFLGRRCLRLGGRSLPGLRWPAVAAVPTAAPVSLACSCSTSTPASAVTWHFLCVSVFLLGTSVILD